MNNVFLFALISVGALAWAGEETASQRLLKQENIFAQKKTAVQLYLIDEDKAVAVRKANLLPNRVHLVSSPMLGGRLYAITNWDGKFSLPNEYLRVGSVVKATLLGGKDVKKKYLLNKSGKWVPTDNAEMYYFYVDDKPTYLKTVSYRDPMP